MMSLIFRRGRVKSQCFTLLEMVMTLFIIALLSGMFFRKYTPYAASDDMEKQMESLRSLLLSARLEAVRISEEQKIFFDKNNGRWTWVGHEGRSVKVPDTLLLESSGTDGKTEPGNIQIRLLPDGKTDLTPFRMVGREGEIVDVRFSSLTGEILTTYGGADEKKKVVPVYRLSGIQGVNR